VTPGTVDILLRAADRVLTAWCQNADGYDSFGKDVGYSWRPSVEWSGRGAISEEASGTGLYEPAIQAVELLLKKWAPRIVCPACRGVGNVPVGRESDPDDYDADDESYVTKEEDYNDAPGRTAAEVAHLLRGAALEGLWPGEEGKT